MIDATYAPGVEKSKYVDLPTTTMDDFELDPAKVCRIDSPDCESCQ
jgi:hypothetical protein